MNSIKILIAAAMIMIASNALTGCSPRNISEVGTQRIMDAQEEKKTVRLSLESVENEDGVNVKVLLKNPEGKPITSAQSWISYNPQVLQGISIDTKNSAFQLKAPYDNTFDQGAGLVMIGRSNPSPVSDKDILVAQILFERVGEGLLMLDAYDYKQDLEGHTSANMMLDGNPINILLKPETPLPINQAGEFQS